MVTVLPHTPRIVLQINQRKRQVATVIIQPESPTIISNDTLSHSQLFTMASLSSALAPPALPDDPLVADAANAKHRRFEKTPAKTYAVGRTTRTAAKAGNPNTQIVTPPDTANSSSVELQSPPREETNEQAPPKKRAKKAASIVQPDTTQTKGKVTHPPIQQPSTGRALRSQDVPKIYDFVPKKDEKPFIAHDKRIMIVSNTSNATVRTRTAQKRSADVMSQESGSVDAEIVEHTDVDMEDEVIPKEATERIEKFDWSQMGPFAKGTPDPLPTSIYQKSHKRWEKMEKDAVASDNRKTEKDIEYLRGELSKLQGPHWKDVLKLPRSCSAEQLEAAKAEKKRIIDFIQSKLRLSDAYATKFKALVKFEAEGRSRSRRDSTMRTGSSTPKSASPTSPVQKVGKKRSASVMEAEEAAVAQTIKRQRKAAPRPKVGQKKTAAKSHPAIPPKNAQKKPPSKFESFEKNPNLRNAIVKKYRTSSRNARPFGQPITRALSNVFETQTDFTLPDDIINDVKRVRNRAK